MGDWFLTIDAPAPSPPSPPVCKKKAQIGKPDPQEPTGSGAARGLIVPGGGYLGIVSMKLQVV